MLEHVIRERLNKAIADTVFPGCCVGVYDAATNTEQYIPVGGFTYDPDSPRVAADTIYDVASVTKSVATGSAILRLINERKITFETPLGDIFGDAIHVSKRAVTIDDLLTYRAHMDVPSLSNMATAGESADDIERTILDAPLISNTRGDIHYNNTTAALLGLIVRKVSGTSLRQFVDEHVYAPLGMHDTTFVPTKEQLLRIPPTEELTVRGKKYVIQGEVHDESTRVLQRQGRYYGAAGLFSSVPDLIAFGKMMLNHGLSHDNKLIFSQYIITMVKTPIAHADAATQFGAQMGAFWFIGSDKLGAA
jgi:CubicO group peptidase (beta-lactamase class C family)